MTGRRMLCTMACFLVGFSVGALAQPQRWQQKIKYQMDVRLDVVTNQIKGSQRISYTNNSNDTLTRVFFHLFYNAFRKGSMMDDITRASERVVLGTDRSGEPVTDFDRRFKYRIEDMTSEEEGYCRVTELLVDGRKQLLAEHETILEVRLDKPVLPRQTISMVTSFDVQVPRLSRRSGRDNPEGIRYSLGQWYPRMCEYDEQGWHAEDYVAREFYGIWGDYEVNITLDKNYKIGATGILRNAAEIGWGYDKEGSALKPTKSNERTWRFAAQNVHDFVWAADPDYKHFTRKVNNGLLLHFIYKPINADTDKKWVTMADSVVMAYPYMAVTFGEYPYPVYSFLHGGGGGTEYPMATLLRGPGLDGAIHEWMHSWYQMLLGSNEVLYAWMDEGFTSYADNRVQAHLRRDSSFAYKDLYDGYFRLAKSRYAESMSTHSNFFATNLAYNGNAYNKGAVFVEQLGYITGAATRDKILKDYYYTWRYKHPNPNDFMRVAEKASGIQLQWYLHYWTNTIKTIDYGIDSLWMNETGGTNVRIRRIGDLPMPLDITLSFRDSAKEHHYLPLSLMFGEKPAEDSLPRKVYAAQPWTKREFIISTNRKIFDIKAVEIDASQRMADIDRKNNRLQLSW